MKLKIKKAFSALLGRSLLGMLISLGSMALIFSHLTPEQYGPIVIGQAIFIYAITISTAGLDTLVSKSSQEIYEGEISGIYFIHIFLMCLAISTSLILISITMSDKVDMQLMSLLSLTYVIRAIATIPAAALESKIEFHKQAIGDFFSQIFYVAILYLLLNKGMALYSVVYAQMGAALIYTIFVLKANLVKPKLPNDWSKMFTFLRQGVLIQSNTWIWQFKDFLLPLLIKEAGGMGLVGLYGLANQLVQKLTFIRLIIWRISIPTIAISKYSPQLSSNIKRGTEIQVFVLSVLILIIGLLIFWLEKYGESRWHGINFIFPALAINMILNSIFSLTCAGLVIWGYFRQLLIFHTLFVIIVLSALYILAPFDTVRAIWVAELAGGAAYLYLARFSKNKFKLINYKYEIFIATIVIFTVVTSTEFSPVILTFLAFILISIPKISISIMRQIYRNLTSFKDLK